MSGSLGNYEFKGLAHNRGLHPVLSPENENYGLIEVYDGEGITTNKAYLPLRYLPIAWFNKHRNDYYVMPKGKIVSIVGQTCTTYPGTVEGSGSTIGYSGIVHSNDFPVGHDIDLVVTGQTLDSDGYPSDLPGYEMTKKPSGYTTPSITAPSSVEYLGGEDYGNYSPELGGVFTFANGGTNSTYEYSSLDIYNTPYANVAGNVKQFVSSASDTLGISANKPFGICDSYIMRDITGRYLAWENQEPMAFWHDLRVSLPYINIVAFNTLFSDENVTDLTTLTGGSACVNTNPLYLLSKIWAFSYAGSGDCSSGLLAPGTTVYPDNHGNYIFRSGVTENDHRGYDEQKVGKLLSIDHRFPRQMNDIVQTFPGSNAGASTETGGLSWRLFNFAKDALLLSGVSLTNIKANKIVEYVQDGIFGIASINIHIS